MTCGREIMDDGRVYGLLLCRKVHCYEAEVVYENYHPFRSLRFASLPTLFSLEPKRNMPDGSQGSPVGGQDLISLPVLKAG